MTEIRNKSEMDALLGFDGASTRQVEPIADGVTLIDFRDTDMNVRHIDALMSSQGIPFRLERPPVSELRGEIRLELTLPRERYAEAAPLLSRAVELSVLEVVVGHADLRSR